MSDRLCFICYDDEDPNVAHWCSCTLVAHQHCLLQLIAQNQKLWCAVCLGPFCIKSERQPIRSWRDFLRCWQRGRSFHIWQNLGILVCYFFLSGGWISRDVCTACMVGCFLLNLFMTLLFMPKTLFRLHVVPRTPQDAV